MVLRRVAYAILMTVSLRAFAASDTFGNFETMGVVAECPAGRTPADIGEVKVYILDHNIKLRVQDAVQVGSLNFFASSLFFLEPGHSYPLQIEFYDHDGKMISDEHLTGATRPEVIMPVCNQSVEVHPAPGALRKALASARGGTALVLRAGTYFEGDLELSCKADAKEPLEIKAFPGETVVLEGSDPDLIGGWQSAGEGLWKHAYKDTSLNVCLTEKTSGKLIRACPMPRLEDLTKRQSGEKTLEKMGIDAAYFCDGQNMTLLAPAADLSKYDVHVAAHTHAFAFEKCAHVWIDGLTIRHYGKGDCGDAIFIQDSSDVVVQRCKIVADNAGVRIKGVCDRLLVQDNEFFDDLLRWEWEYMKNDQRGGVAYHGTVETGCVFIDGKYSGRGLVVRHNRIEGFFDAAHISPESLDAVSVRTHETDFYRNRIVAACDDFIEVKGRARNVRIFDNVMENCLSGISPAQSIDGPVWILYNLIARVGNSTGAAMDSYEGYPIKTNGGTGTDIGSGYVFMYHNTASTFNPADSAFLVKGAKWKKFVFRNNIWMGHSGGFVSWRDTLSPIDMQNDLLYSEKGPAVKINKTESAPGDKGSGVALNFIFKDPKLIDANKGDYRLSPESPCIGAGVVLPGVNDHRYIGKGPDLGFCRHDGGAPPAAGPRPESKK